MLLIELNSCKETSFNLRPGFVVMWCFCLHRGAVQITWEPRCLTSRPWWSLMDILSCCSKIQHIFYICKSYYLTVLSITKLSKMNWLPAADVQWRWKCVHLVFSAIILISHPPRKKLTLLICKLSPTLFCCLNIQLNIITVDCLCVRERVFFI